MTTSTTEPAGHIPMHKQRDKVYPRSVNGFLRRLKWWSLALLLGLYYVAPWIRWDRGPDAPDQAILLDMAGRRAYFFAIEIWPQEVYYLTGILILGAVGLFLATALFGRVWCGYACPQTVWTDLFLWVEQKIEGDRSERIRLDRSPWSMSKAAKKVGKHAAWVVIALLTGGSWILYFYDAPSFVRDAAQLQLSVTVLSMIALFTASTYLLAGWAREQVCTYMCPWPRFQSAMLDEESVIVTYESWRGEGRGPTRKSESWDERLARGGGDCIDCKACVQVCPTGIDIRDGQQLECIGCGLCADACDDIMTRIGRPTGLVRFDTHNNQVARSCGKPTGFRLVRPRTVVYSLILVVVAAVMLGTLMLRPRLEINVIRDRAPLFVELSDGRLRNAYTFKVLNMAREPKDYVLTVAGIPGATLGLAGQETEGPELVIHAAPDSVSTNRIYVTAPRASASAASTPVEFRIVERRTEEEGAYDTVFLGPGK